MEVFRSWEVSLTYWRWSTIVYGCVRKWMSGFRARTGESVGILFHINMKINMNPCWDANNNKFPASYGTGRFILCSQEPATCLSWSDQSSPPRPHSSCFLKIRFNIFPPSPRSYQVEFLLQVSRNPFRVSSIRSSATCPPYFTVRRM